MADVILVLNAGSSSIKFGLFGTSDPEPKPLLRGLLEDQGHQLRLTAKADGGAVLVDRHWPEGASHEAMLGCTLECIEHHLGSDPLVAVGHRIVHGGQDFTGPVRLDTETIAAVDKLTPLAPLHQPRSLLPIRALQKLRPDLPQIGCFDTAFHHTLAPAVSRYAIPRRFEAEGVRKYGFHGLSYEFIASRLAAIDPALPAKRTVVAHLGNGASLCAMQNGRSLDTTMGFSTLDGLVMGTRPGLLDPGVVIYLQRTHDLSAEAVEHLLYHECGLLGISGISNDMRTLAESNDARAREAIDLFTFRVGRETAALAHTMGGLDALVFTGGIGEHSGEVRAAVCRRLEWLGLACDGTANAEGASLITCPESRVTAYVIPTDEEMTIARHVRAMRITA